MSFNYLQVTTEEKMAVITINRPKVLNALKYEVLLELQEAFNSLREDNEVKVVIITGSGEKAFVAGADIGVMANLGPLEAQKYIRAGHETFDLIAAFPKPVIAAVNGFALGGGLELALACDYIFAVEEAKFGLPEITLGIIPGWGGTQRLPQAVGIGRARELVYTGKVIDAQEAEKIGLVNRLFPADGFLTAVQAEAKTLVQRSLVALNMAKTAINAHLDAGGPAGKTVEIQSVCICFASNDQKEGMAAFQEKRKPKFTDS
ncbi:enoyl-CoA hydratase/isomerase family protein [Dethiobacter alkaliphilus]|uniref:Enoyl-CoA hydratase/isomerase n=1 Tax=Dethiobacter alkaliphilus AHT 1 TaxID=555088 RepID=C0GEG5_DETAL|nr:enoyl-CoA hydratase-related protein [Dethiobacter alkaliphilus]EEG78459.1 Enoyl-CoA hydratase/isomerase [Dethiobacter alkaliphilus AHT 1]MCW3490356.1 enoyl-CoA hydratase-related protein [Dethiobacter alkaliphilus]